MTRKDAFLWSAMSLVGLALLGLGFRYVGVAQAGQAVEAPRFEVDVFWPKPMPNQWLLGSAVGIAADGRDQIHVVHRTDSFNRRTEIGAATDPPTGDCCRPAPNVLVFDAAGTLLRHWGGPGEGYTWPASNHRIAVDPSGNVWIGGNGEGDAHLVKFSGEGRFIAQYGRPRQASDDGGTDGFGAIAKISFDAAAGEAYVADALNGGRVVVLDMNTGAVKRLWGAYGEAPRAVEMPAYSPDAPPARQFRTVHCAEPSNDGHVYVCDRGNNRIQVFRKDGTFVKEVRVAPRTLGDGSVWDIAFSRDPAQRFLYVADGSNMKVHVLDRQSLDVLTSFGTGGRQPGQFFAIHSITTDSRGNVYTAETLEGKRVQKFEFKGVGPVTSANQGVVWPRR